MADGSSRHPESNRNMFDWTSTVELEELFAQQNRNGRDIVKIMKTKASVIPSDPKTRLLYAKALCESPHPDDYKTAAIVLQELVDDAINPETTRECLVLQAMICLRSGEYRRSRRICQRLLNRNPNDVQASVLFQALLLKVSHDGKVGIFLTLSVVLATAYISLVISRRVR